MSMMNNLKGKIKEVDSVIDEFMESPCCGEDTSAAKREVKKK